MILRAIFFCMLLVSLHGLAQNRLVLERRARSGRHKTLSLHRVYTITTLHGSHYSNIIGIKDSCLLLPSYKKTSDTSITIIRYPNPAANDTIIGSKYRPDTLRIPIRDVISLEKRLIKNSQEYELFGYAGAAAIFGLVVGTPIITVADGSRAGMSTALGCLGALAVCAPVLFLCSREIKYDLKRKWKIIY